jgi:hypothetical protein
MKSYGGYFGLELYEGTHKYHSTPYTFKSGRASLAFILNSIKPKKVYLPYYCCDSLLEPIKDSKINYVFYSVNPRFEPDQLPVLSNDELFIYVNYFDLKRDYINKLSGLYKEQLIADCTQSYYLKGNGVSWYFNSCRKFFGVPDGSFLYVPESLEKRISIIKEENKSFIVDHLISRFNGDVNGGYKFSLKNEEYIDSQPIAMSKLTKYLLSNIDYEIVKKTRQNNYIRLSNLLSRFNTMSLEFDSVNSVPNYFPLMINRAIDMRTFWKDNLFFPYLWEDCLNRLTNGYEFEKHVASSLIPITIDQRYSCDDMDYIAEKIVARISSY